ncbi:MAG TPA: capsule assembly Wzi family protein [Bryobacteraceae bacterium]|nr:capsule assembly Wzi family protein [Bryobacteraceae bacterium]
MHARHAMRLPPHLRHLLAFLVVSCVCSAEPPKQENVEANSPSGAVTNANEAATKTLLSDAHDYFAYPRSQTSGKPSASALPRNIWHDQKAIWTSPSRFRKSDLRWLLPLAATAGVLIGTDRHVMTLIHSDARNRRRSTQLSDAGLATFGLATVASYGFGTIMRDEHARETGVLAAEALADSFLAVEALKLVSNRQRPDTASGRGLFGHASGVNSSFPSQNSALAWAAATVFAREYPGPVMQWGAYGLASLVSLSRVTAERHFPSDVLIGAAAGYLIGRFVYGRHHDDRISDRTGATPISAAPAAGDGPVTPARGARHSGPANGSPYVALDSWIYPALRRLAAMGYVPDQVSDLAPWTRAECLFQTEEAADLAANRDLRLTRPALNEEALNLIAALKTELAGETSADTTFRLESLYTRVTGISGTPLRDSYHFGQTVVNDYGRPYEKGFSNVSGFAASATSGAFFAYFRGEYQGAPGRDAASLGVRQFIARMDVNPLQGPRPVASTSHFEPLEMYAGVRLGFENITFGKQSLWWGPGAESAFSFSNNAAPFYMLRFAQAAPLVLPGFLSHLGKIRTELIFGKLSGHQWPPRPYVNAQKISLALTDNFEIGFTRSAFFGGVGRPLTWGTFASSLISTVSKGARDNLGDRHSGFDFRYRIPGLRRYVTVYSDSYADDDPSPIDNPRRSAWAPGLYLSQIPGLRKLDFRFETYSTWLYMRDLGGSFIYWNNEYHDSYTNKGYLLGSWIGRDSRAYLASTTYWFSAKSKLQAQYRQIKVGNNLLPGGGTQTDISTGGQWSLNAEWMITAKAQYERYYLPILGGPQKDILGSLAVIFTPAWGR